VPNATPCPYRSAGYADRKDYLNSLHDEYGADIVNAVTACLPASEDFDGLITALEDWAEQEENW
jgi:hypothetical protein